MQKYEFMTQQQIQDCQFDILKIMTADGSPVKIDIPANDNDFFIVEGSGKHVLLYPEGPGFQGHGDFTKDDIYKLCEVAVKYGLSFFDCLEEMKSCDGYTAPDYFGVVR
jgi:hypothetical protein